MELTQELQNKMKTGCIISGIAYGVVGLFLTIYSLIQLVPMINILMKSKWNFAFTFPTLENKIFGILMAYLLVGGIIFITKTFKYIFRYRPMMDDDPDAFFELFEKYHPITNTIFSLIVFFPAIIPIITVWITILTTVQPMMKKYRQDEKDKLKLDIYNTPMDARNRNVKI